MMWRLSGGCEIAFFEGDVGPGTWRELTSSMRIDSRRQSRTCNRNRQLNRMVHADHDIAAALVESRFDEAFLHLHRNCCKRILVVLISSAIDDQNARRMKAHIATPVGRHLSLTVCLRDHELFDPLFGVDPEADMNKQDKGVLYRAASAADIFCWRRQVLTDLQRSGALTSIVSWKVLRHR